MHREYTRAKSGGALRVYGKGRDILVLGIWEYIWQWGDRIQKEPHVRRAVYKRLQFRGVAANIREIKGEVDLIYYT